MNFVGTVAEFADSMKVDYQTASGLIRYLKIKGIAIETGVRKPKKGKPSVIYMIPGTVELTFVEPVITDVDFQRAKESTFADYDNLLRLLA